MSPQRQTMSVLINKLQRSAEDGFRHSSRELSKLLACILTLECNSEERVFKSSNTMVTYSDKVYILKKIHCQQ